MSEDEAFIRTLVDTPGDDLPRLVYADWLDERSDPRGAYLRAEVEWAKTRREVGWAPPTALTPRQWAVPTLRQMAEALDPVWVARVSRPPEGVCCDHLRWENRGEALEPVQLVATIKCLGHDMPAVYAAFLLNYNGGKPIPNQLDLGICWATVDVFTSIAPNQSGGCVDLATATVEVRTRCRLSSSWLVLGWSKAPNVYWEEFELGQEAFLMSVKKTSKAFGRVIYWSDVSPRGLTRETREIAGYSLPDFLSLLRTKSSK